MEHNKPTIVPSKEIGNLSVALFSLEQDCFHIETLLDYIQTSIKHSLIKDRKSDWVLIGVFKNDVDADAGIEVFKKIILKARTS